MKMEIPKDISLKDLLLDFSPKMAKEMIAESGAAADLAGTEFSMVVDVSGDQYSYVVKNGTDFDVKEGGMDNPMIKINIAQEDLQKMIEMDTMDMFLGVQGDLNKSKYDAIVNVKGSLTIELTNDGSVMPIKITLNGAETPHTILKMKTADSIAVVNKETNPVNLFMSGGLQIEGDMAFAMQLQPIFG